ncbi:NUDIX hydrolase [Kosakonia oryzae]|uniref:hypothetical protein n=1 Tax=Kosakonia oryzae TaxID=497725 RepID=UPI001D079379|nr:hypothetical protein [Kosakonia oryzae]UDJ85246.1 hypothetical protein I5186_16930 [Kosakonia oryzae]
MKMRAPLLSPSGSLKNTLNGPDKHGDMRWQTIEELPENTIPYVRQAINALLAGELYSEYGW